MLVKKFFQFQAEFEKEIWFEEACGCRINCEYITKIQEFITGESECIENQTFERKNIQQNAMGVRAYNQWRDEKLLDVVNFDYKVFDTDLRNVETLTKESFIHAMCIFIPSVTKVKDGSDYPGKTLYEMVTSIQKYLHQNKVPWKIIDGPEFIDVKNVLDNVMKERALYG